MGKREIKILGILGCLTLIGTAGAAWNFSSQTRKATELDVNIDTYVSSGEIKINDADESGYLFLDKSGISWVNASDISASYSETGNNITRTWTLSLSDNLLSYIDLPNSSSSYKNVSWSDNQNITLPTLTWKSGKNPTTIEEYNTMKTNLNGAKVTITFEAKIL